MVIDELFIAEKPSVGKAIAENLGGTATAVRGRDNRPTHYIVGNRVVTWVFGHILEQAEPEDYNSAFKTGSWADSASLLPVIPGEWKLKPVADAKAQLAVIQNLLKTAKCVIHAGDPDREGQLLVDEVLYYLDNKSPVKRILPNAIDDKSMKRILANVVDNAQYLGLYRSGLGRQRADWLVGMNMSRACTISNQRGGLRGTLSIGRVQTPTLALVVKRDLEIENFKPQTYYAMVGTFQHAAGSYTGKWVAPKGLAGLDKEGRLIDAAVASKLKATLEGQAGQVTEYKVENQSQGAPLPFSLTTLQRKADTQFKMGAKQVLDICQSLYEKKLTTYPRTDSQHLPEEQFSEAKSVLMAIAKFDPSLMGLVQGTTPTLRSAAWNSKKATPHHAIVPTGEANFGVMTEPEKKIFFLIAKQFIAQFFPDYTFTQTSVVTVCAGNEFRTSGRTPLDLGWRKVFASEEKAEKEKADKEGAGEDTQLVPLMAKGHPVKCTKIAANKKNTKAPDRFTEATLIHAMTNVHEEVDDPELKKKLKEVKGIGTVATQAATIETLKERQFVSAQIEKGKIISTPAGRALIQALPKELTSVSLTALWENALDQIERGSMNLDRFMEGQALWIKKLTRQALESKISVPVGFKNEGAAQAASNGAGKPCPQCKTGTLRVIEAKKGDNKGKFFLSCSNYFSETPCKYSEDIAGQDEPARRTGGKRGGSSGRRS